MEIYVCIGSSCHVKGAGQVLDTFREQLKEKNLGDKVELAGKFCIGKCTEGVCVTVDGELFSVEPKSAKKFFEKEVERRALI
mgnify:FL=1